MSNSGRPKNHDVIADEIRRVICSKQFNEVFDLLENNINTLDGHARTPLFYAVFEDRTQIVEWLLKNGADCNHQDRNGWSNLHSAVQNGKIELIKMLLANGATLTLVDEHGNEPLWTACHQACLAKRSDDCFEIIRLLVTHGANINHKNIYGKSPIDMAQKRSKKVLDVLLGTTF